jgi:hypothetical protein
MKKTIVAAAVAALTAAPAFADVTISGAVQVEAGEEGSGGASSIKTKSDIFFKGSEDLGNGMKAGFLIQRTADDQSAVSSGSDRFVTLSTGTVNVKAGYFEHYMESSIGGAAANDAAHDVSNEISVGEINTSSTNAGDSVEVSFSPMAGATVGYQLGDNADTVFAQYSNGGLMVRVAQENNASEKDILGIVAQYKLDDLTLRVVDMDNDADADQTWLGAEYTMGANTFGVSVVDGNGDGADDGDMTVSLKHALSKRTNVYIAHGSDDDTSANDETLVGIKHSF